MSRIVNNIGRLEYVAMKFEYLILLYLVALKNSLNKEVKRIKSKFINQNNVAQDDHISQNLRSFYIGTEKQFRKILDLMFHF